MLTLNINKLRNEVEEREKKKINTFEKVLDMTFKKILHSNENYSDYCCTFLVPNVVFGLPLYNVAECCGFIIEKLIEKGFEVYLAVPTTLHISWKPKNKINNTYNTYNEKYNNTPKLQQIQYYNANNSLDTSSNKQIAIKNRNTNKYNTLENTQGQNQQQNKQQHQVYQQQQNNNLNSRSINDYKQDNILIYDSNDLELFKNKLDNLFD